MSVSQPKAQTRPDPVPGVSMHDLLAACAAATAVSTPPRVPEPQRPEAAPDARREAA
ncbi:hypothetical protein ACLGIH_13155 [Streptomyces sp. HMX87]|uniref:hypothetical protein n=1 Tax=Streptomyces sp. HMX87 TaxID=3390849 RepID=UPI003A8A71E9